MLSEPIQNIFNRLYPVPSQSTRVKMPPKATTTKRPTPAGSKPSGPATGAGRPAGTTARPRPTAGPSKPRIPQRAGASASGSGTQAKPQVDVKPTVNVGEEEWARLMKETYGGKQSAEWYAKGAKSVEVSRRETVEDAKLKSRINGNYYPLSSKSKVSSSNISIHSISLLKKISRLS
jgi:hypothetical protein